ncbi:MAG: DUF4962 domain-containing protein [Candidatus Brocadiia bacterium]
MPIGGRWVAVLVFLVTVRGAAEGAAKVDDSPAGPGEWGFRPAEGATSATDPPAFVWRPQRGAASYEVQVARDAAFRRELYEARDIRYNCHCPPRALGSGRWHWRFRFLDRGGSASAWSQSRSFRVGADAVVFPMPSREELLGRIPKAHPRLFVRPEQLGRLRELARGELSDEYRGLVAQCRKLLQDPPSTEEPPKYPPGVKRKSEQWRKIWWGNRVRTIRVLNGAATLGFTRLLDGNEEFGRAGRRLLLAAAEWDPRGSTGYRYNDEAGMPYAYYFARTYSFVHDLLSEAERAKCRQVMALRGREMYDHLSRSHIWRPYGSHRNRAWHFLGEVGIAFLGEVPEAEEWVWFAVNVFYNVYPVWSDAQGGWHEGVAYWRSYIHRFTWWADAMRVAMGIDAYRKPYFSQAGYYPMYLQPPGTRGGGFGDLCARRTAGHNRGLMSVLAAQAANPHWQWYVEALGGPRSDGGYIGFVRGTLPAVEARPPDDLPAARCFWGTGQAYLNTSLRDAEENVAVLFKSSPFGTQSHGYESSNSFLLYAYGQRLLIRTGRRDIYGSDHHRNWMWHTRSTNCITVDGRSQRKHSAAARGEVLAFHTSPLFAYVAGEAGGAYRPPLERFTRHILFLKPGLVVITDRLRAPEPASFQWWLHAPTEMQVGGPRDIRVANDPAACRVSFLAPKGLDLELTNEFDPPPRPRVKLVEWHLTATPRKKRREETFVTVIRPHRAGETPPEGLTLKELPNGYALEAALERGRAVVLLRSGGGAELRYGPYTTKADLAAVRLDPSGAARASLVASGREVRVSEGGLED